MSKAKFKNKIILLVSSAIIFLIFITFSYLNTTYKKPNSADLNHAALKVIKQAQIAAAEDHITEENEDNIELEAQEELAREDFIKSEILGLTNPNENEEFDIFEESDNENQEPADSEEVACEDCATETEDHEMIEEVSLSENQDQTPLDQTELKSDDSRPEIQETEKQISKSENDENQEINNNKKVISSPFSTEGHVLSVTIAGKNDAAENEIDPYEDILTPAKIEEHKKPKTVNINPAPTPSPLETKLKDQEELAARLIKLSDQSKTYLNATTALSRLTFKFLQKADFSNELDSIDQTNLPPEVKEVLADMRSYAENEFKNIKTGELKIFPKEGVLDKIVGHFMQIEKVPDLKSKNEKYEQICKKLHILEDYFHSQKFLNEIISHD